MINQKSRKKQRTFKLSANNHRLLIKICRHWGTASEARHDPNFVLQKFLKEVDENKDSVSACLSPLLDSTVSKTTLEYLRRVQKAKRILRKVA